MNKKMMLLALSVVSAALFALPAVASAEPAHISATEAFSITAGPVTTAATLETTTGEKVTCSLGATGSGSFENTTTGTINLTFKGCKGGGIVNCQSAGQPEGTIVTTALPFHLITVPAKGQHAGVLITPGPNNPEGKPHFATFSCPLVGTKVVTGNGVIGTITSPTCGGTNTTATLSFKQGASTGTQQHTTYTGTPYGLLSNGAPAAQEAEARIHFGSSKTIICT